MRKQMKRILDAWTSVRKSVRISILTFLGIFLFYLTCVYHVEPNEMGISWNPFSGKLSGDTLPGFYVSPPWEMASIIDLRPCRVCITSTANSYSCKLVSFQTSYWEDFVRTQGFGYWWWNNRISFNYGYDAEYRGFRDVLRGYAYSNKKYRFIEVSDDYSEME